MPGKKKPTAKKRGPGKSRAKPAKRKGNTGETPSPKPPLIPPEPVELVATTISEAAVLLGVAPRTMAAWCTEPGFPGTPGGPGRQDGHFPIAAIRTWHLAMHGGSRSRDEDAETVAARKLKTLIEVDHAQVELEEALGTIGDTEAMANFCRRVVAAAKAQLEEVADRVNARLPSKLPAATRALIRKVIGESITRTLNTFAELVAGDRDDDDTEDLPDDAADV